MEEQKIFQIMTANLRESKSVYLRSRQLWEAAFGCICTIPLAKLFKTRSLCPKFQSVLIPNYLESQVIELINAGLSLKQDREKTCLHIGLTTVSVFDPENPLEFNLSFEDQVQIAILRLERAQKAPLKKT